MRHPAWSGKPLSEMVSRELAEAIVYLESTEHEDKPLLQALHDELARRIAAEESPANPEPPPYDGGEKTLEGEILNGLPPQR